ncbi:hypothetical protein ACIBPB_29760 [Micromonospora sp. NPDC049836]|uniref:hypothetical protein n=1 Tax=Micromonospora sp. NPDC049836 TaxID=3364274 RepID=UPI0037B42A07
MTQALLEAGAILPGAPADAGSDVVTARRYAHPALSGRTVVRLTGAALGEAEDLSLEFLGFTRAGAPAPVGVALRRAVGFPAWALVNDPANGRHALALVKEMSRLARTALAKPGNARDGYQQLAERLGAAAPHFLPTFWEQAGRAFLAADNTRMAGSCFTDARRAEQVHGLPVDEERLREVHLEFAFAGALTARMLTEYARGVSTRRPAAEAYDLVRTLAVRRVAGGLPPYASMADDLRRLARAAGLDPERQAAEVITQLLALPAVVRAQEGFWKAYRKPLERAARADAAVRARLLDLLPEPPGWSTDLTALWLDLLDSTGALADLLAGAPGAPPAHRWLTRLLLLRERRHQWRCAPLIAAVERLAPRLRAEGQPVQLSPTGSHSGDLDVLDACRAGGVPVTVEPQQLNVTRWAHDDNPDRRDLAAVAADAALRPLLAAAAVQALTDLHRRHGGTGPLPTDVVTGVLGVPGLRDVLAEALAERVARVAAAGTVPVLADLRDELAGLASPAGVALAPAALAGFARVDVPAVLARTLRAGLLVEFGWPAYEAAEAGMLPARFGDAWPQLVVHDNQVAHVIEPDGSTTEHLFRYPPADSPHARSSYAQTGCQLVGDQLLVHWHGGRARAGYWSADPDTVFELGQPNEQAFLGRRRIPLPLPGGAVTTGSRPWHAGDTRGPAGSYPVATDGRTYWRCEPPGAAGEWRWREYDPATGAAGRHSLPAFFAAPLPDGATLVPDGGELRPAPAGYADSPLGFRDGLVGWRLATLPDGTQLGEGVDGRTVTWRPEDVAARTHHAERLVGALRMPGGDLLPVTAQPRGHHEPRWTVWTADGRQPLERGGPSRYLPPLGWWHALRPRDAPGSARLRRLTPADAERMLAIEDTVTGSTALTEAAAARVAEVLPEVTAPALRSALADLVARAVRLRRRLGELAALLATGPAAAPAAADGIADDELRESWAGLLDREVYRYHYGSVGRRTEILPQIRGVAELLRGGPADGVPASSPDWLDALGGLGALALRAASPVTGAAERNALSALLAALADPILAEGTVRTLLVRQTDGPPRDRVEVHRDGDQVTVLFAEHDRIWNVGGSGGYRRRAVQLRPDGRFTPPPGVTVEAEAVAAGRRDAGQLREFCRLLAEHGPAPWRPEQADRLVARTGMSRPEAVLLLAGLPGFAAWQANFLSPAQRGVLGVTMAQAKVGRAALRSLTPADRLALLDAALPADPAALWRTGPDVDALAERWLALRGARVGVPEQLLTEAARILPARQVAELLQAIAEPRAGSWLTTDGVSEALDWGGVRMGATEGTAFSGEWLAAGTTALLWLAYRLPWGDPLRAALPRAVALLRDRLRNPKLLVGAAWFRADRPPVDGSALVAGHATGDHVLHHVAPARLTGADDPALGFLDAGTADALRLVLSPRLDAVVATPDGVTGDARDPRVSVPDLVDAVAGHTGLGRDHAAYYLQLLALPDPTDVNVRGWNGWRPAALKQAQAALVDAGLVVAAKRERAGRGVFLPGGWHPARHPSVPLETWKRPLYPAGDVRPVVDRPLSDLFRHAWQRVTAGDPPRYLDLREQP